MWVKLDDKFPRHPKVLQAGPLAAWLYVCGLVYCGQFLTDGVVPEAVVPTLADFGSVPGALSIAELVEQLLSVGLWERVPGGYRIHDYLEYNPSREAVQKRRDGERVVRKAGGRARAERGGRDLSGRFESPAAAPASDQQTVGVSAGEVSGSSTHASPSSIPAGQLALSASIAPAPSRSRTRTEEEKKSSHLDGVPAADARKATNPGIPVAIHAFAAAHRKHLGTPYVPNYGRDGKALKRLLTTYTLEQVLACLPLYFADEKSIERIGARIPLFVDRVPTLAARLGDRASEGDPSRTDLAETWERRWTKEGDPS